MTKIEVISAHRELTSKFLETNSVLKKFGGHEQWVIFAATSSKVY